MTEPLGLSSSSSAPTCQHRLGFFGKKDLGGGSQGLVSRIVIDVGRPNVPTWVGRWQDEGVRQWWRLSDRHLRWRPQRTNMGLAGMRKDLGVGGDGGASRLGIVVGRSNMPIGVGSWQEEGAWWWREMTYPLCVSSSWAAPTCQHGFGH